MPVSPQYIFKAWQLREVDGLSLRDHDFPYLWVVAHDGGAARRETDVELETVASVFQREIE